MQIVELKWHEKFGWFHFASEKSIMIGNEYTTYNIEYIQLLIECINGRYDFFFRAVVVACCCHRCTVAHVDNCAHFAQLR